MIIPCEQKTPEWLQLRCGRVTGSRITDVLAEIKKGEAATRRNYRTEIIAETLTGLPAESYISPAMQWGIDTEPFARAAYELTCNTTVDTVGFAIHPHIPRFGCSPDGLLGDDGGAEFKCPNTATHLDWILAGVVPEEHKPQMLANMSCTGRKWWEFVSFDPRLPRHLQLFIRRFVRDETRIAEIEAKVQKFLAEVDDVIFRLDATTPIEENPRTDSLLTQLQDSLSAVLDRKHSDEVTM
jgi:hypothetical protein